MGNERKKTSIDPILRVGESYRKVRMEIITLQFN